MRGRASLKVPSQRTESVPPRRIRLSRAKGWRKPEGAIVVARPTKWGNPFPIQGDWVMWYAVGLGLKGHAEGRRVAAVELHRAWITHTAVRPAPVVNEHGAIVWSDGTEIGMESHVRGLSLGFTAFCEPPEVHEPPTLDVIRAELAGHDLACWCPLDQACHADVLLELANS